MTRIHADVPDRSGTLIDDRYEIVRTIGGGETGAVYEARQIRLDKPVALKLLHPELAENPTIAARFLAHAQAVSRIRHPNVVDIIDFGEHEGIPYFAMEYLEGLDLEELVESSGPLPWARARGILKQTALALEAAHLQGMAHHNVKASNCFLLTPTDPDGDAPWVKILDFGANPTVGDVHPPERLGSGAIDTAPDVVALGALACRALTGAMPFTPLTPAERKDTRAPLRQLDPSIPADVEAWILRTLARDSAPTFTTMTEARLALRELDPSLAGASSAAMSWGTLGSGVHDLTTPHQAKRGAGIRWPGRHGAMLGAWVSATIGVVVLADTANRSTPTPVAQVERITTSLTREPPPLRRSIAAPSWTPVPVASPPPQIDDALSDIPERTTAGVPRPSRRAVTRVAAETTNPEDLAPEDACALPFTLDERGHKHFKRQCLE